MKKGRVLAIIALIVLFITACSDSNIYREYKALCKVDGVYFTSLQEAVDYATASNSSPQKAALKSRTSRRSLP